MSKKSPSLPSRRQFLRSLAGASVAGAAASVFPWLSQARADVPGQKKLLLYYTPHGTIWDQWRPTGGETSFALSPILAPLERHRSQVSIIDGLAMHAPYAHRVPHTYDMVSVFTGSPIDTTSTLYTRADHGVSFGWNTGTSIDQTIANRLMPSTPHRTLEFGLLCGGRHPNARMIYTGPAMPKDPLDNPLIAWNHLFNTTGETAPRQRILDAVREDMSRITPRLSGTDRIRLDAHATALQELEASLGSLASECSRVELPAGAPETLLDQQAGLITAALSCGHSRIASMQVRKGDNDNSLYPWVGLTESGHHTLSHDSSAAASMTRTNLYRWYADRFAHLLDLMAMTPDGEGTSLLDNTMVIWASEIGVGWTHNIDNVPYVVAGGTAHGVRGGRYLDLRTQGRYHNRLLVSAAHYMGLADMETYGSTDMGSGGVPGLLSL